MGNLSGIRNKIVILIIVVLSMAGKKALADYAVLDMYVGRWDAHVKTLEPEQSETTYTEVYEWVLNRKFLRGRTKQKSDGAEDISYGTYDPKTKGLMWQAGSTFRA